MSKTEGEYELVLGNRQLLSAFFIIVILFGVFFTMGYVVGRNSAPACGSIANARAGGYQSASRRRVVSARPVRATPDATDGSHGVSRVCAGAGDQTGEATGGG